MRRLLPLVLVLAVLIGLDGCGEREHSQQSTGRPSPKLNEAQQHHFADLTIRHIMQGPGLVGVSPSTPRFSADGLSVFFEWNSPGRLDSLNAVRPDSLYQNYLDVEHDKTTWRLDVASGALERLGDARADTLAPDTWAWDRGYTRRAELRGGDVFLVDPVGHRTRRVTATVAVETSIQMAPDGATVWFVRDGNVYAVPWSGAPVTQLTDLRTANDPKAEHESSQRRYLAREQEELFDYVRRMEHDERVKRVPRPHPIWLGKGWRVEDALVSPSGKYAALALRKKATGARNPVVPQFVTESGYVETRDARRMVGDVRDSTRVTLVDLSADSLITVGTDASWRVTPMAWAPAADVLLLRGLSADWHDRYFVTVTPSRRTRDGALEPRELDHYHDNAWVGGPDFYSTGSWLPDGSGIWFISEAEGWAHLYTVTLDGRRKRLTSGEWEVHDAFSDPRTGGWLLVTNEGDPGSSRLWRMDADGSNRRLLTPDLGWYDVTISSDARRAAVLRSRVDEPAELYTVDLVDGHIDGPHTQSTTKAFGEYKWIVPEVITFKASDGVRVRAHIFRPRQFGVKPNGAGVVFIHGAGYLQNVNDQWSYYYREYMFHHFLAVHGYTVLNVDYRGSAGYGQAWRTAIYKHMGGRDLDDIVDAAHYLVRHEDVDPKRVGVYGGSYGGFLTLMAMFKAPDVFAAGAGLRSVTDWAHYNDWYTSRILGLPSEDPDAYRRSSPIYFADGLKGRLLMLHGLRDDNVLASDILRLSERLIELEKQNWELALNPVEKHAYERASSWTDEYRRIYRLFDETIGPHRDRAR